VGGDLLSAPLSLMLFLRLPSDKTLVPAPCSGANHTSEPSGFRHSRGGQVRGYALRREQPLVHGDLVEISP
jgi:hypothetical protein